MPVPLSLLVVEPARLVAALRRHIARLEGAGPSLGAAPRQRAPWRLGVPLIDDHVGAGGLARYGLHDLTPAIYNDMAAAMGFAVALALRYFDGAPHDRRPLLWCRLDAQAREHGRLYGHGLETLGLPRARFVTVTLRKPVEVLWTAEEALKCGALSLVIADAEPRLANLTATRRLSLAAAKGRSAGLLVFRADHGGAVASHSRWTIASAPSRAPPFDLAAPGPPRWDVALTRGRGGRPGQWRVEWHHARHRFDLVAGIPGRALHPHADEAGAQRPAETLRAG